MTVADIASNAADIINPPPLPKILDYPALMTVIVAAALTTAMLFVSGKFDPTGGPLTISLMIVIAFLGMVAFTLFFTVPTDEITSAVAGALVLAFGAIIAYWLGRPPRGPPT
jgi:FtsH-binding integral membrane protein